jgi:RND superfamily putative drug exporter
MSRTTHHTNLAGRMGRWSARHRKTAVFGWLVFTVVAFALGGVVGTTDIDATSAGPGQSGRMDRILSAGFKQPAAESILIQSRSLRAGNLAFRATIADVARDVSTLPEVTHVRATRFATDGHSALVELDIRGDKDEAVDKIQPVLDRVAAAQRAHPGFSIGEFGDASAQKGVETAYGNDLGEAGLLSLPITLIILVVTFGALMAAGIPLLLALTAVFATFGLIALPSQLLPVAQQAPAMVLLIGLAVGVDYSKFYLQRARQERAAGRSADAAPAAAAAT